MNAEQAWQATLGQLQMDMSKAAYDTWVKNSRLVSFDRNQFTIGVPNAYARDWLATRLTITINRVLSGIMNQPQSVSFVVCQKDQESTNSEQDDEPAHEVPQLTTAVPIQTHQGQKLNSKYTFENYVVGSGNRLAHAASMAVADQPARSYNPLFLYGGVGLGKTHLLQAIGNRCLANGLQVRYVTSEEFTNDLIQAIRTHTTMEFREKYRQSDVLLIDDIQFIAGKESTQEEFFHTFNTLHGQDKQLVISSDRPPKAMNTLEERLRSRFEWGLTVDIQPPDLETRIAVLRSKAERTGRQVPSEILDSIARQIQSNIRELEGALTRVLAYSELIGQPLSMQLVNVALADLLPKRSKLEPTQVLYAVAAAFGIDAKELLGKDRSREIALPRQVAMYLMREEANFSLPQIGEALGGRDHTTVMYGCDKIADLIERDDRLRRQLIQIREQLYGRQRVAV